MKRSVPKIGSFLRIPLSDGTFGYGRMLDLGDVAFYNYRTTEPSTDLDAIAARSVLFRQGVRLTGLKNWNVVGVRDLEGEVAKP